MICTPSCANFIGAKLLSFGGAIYVLATSCLPAEEIRFRSPGGDKWISISANEEGVVFTYQEGGRGKPQALWKAQYADSYKVDCDVSWSIDNAHFAITDRHRKADEVTFYECSRGKAERIAAFPDETVWPHINKLLTTKNRGFSGAGADSYQFQIAWLEHHVVKIQDIGVTKSVNDGSDTGKPTEFSFEILLNLDTKKFELRDWSMTRW